MEGTREPNPTPAANWPAFSQYAGYWKWWQDLSLGTLSWTRHSKFGANSLKVLLLRNRKKEKNEWNIPTIHVGGWHSRVGRGLVWIESSKGRNKNKTGLVPSSVPQGWSIFRFQRPIWFDFRGLEALAGLGAGRLEKTDLSCLWTSWAALGPGSTGWIREPPLPPPRETQRRAWVSTQSWTSIHLVFSISHLSPFLQGWGLFYQICFSYCNFPKELFSHSPKWPASWGFRALGSAFLAKVPPSPPCGHQLHTP